MFDLGSASGLLNLKGKFDTKEGEKSLKSLQNAKQKFSKLNEVTVGAFNNLTKTEAVETKEAKKEAVKLTAEQRKDLEAKVAKDWNATVADDMGLDESQASIAMGLTEYTVSQMSDEELAEAAKKIDDKNKSFSEKLSDAVDSAKSFAEDTFSTLKDEFCAVSPFAACASCPKRVTKANGGVEIPDIMGMIGDIVKDVMDGLESAALALIGCPGLVAGVKSGLLNGDWDNLQRGVMNGGIEALQNTAVKMGSSAVLGALGDVIPTDQQSGMIGKVGSMLKNAGSGKDSYNKVAATMTGLMVAGDNLMQVTSYAKDGNISQAYKALTESSRKSGKFGQNMGRSNVLATIVDYTTTYRGENSVTGLMTSMVNKCYQSAEKMTSAVSTTNIQTRASFPAYKMSALPGTTISTHTLKTGYGISAIKKGTKPPSDVKVRRIKNSVSNRLV